MHPVTRHKHMHTFNESVALRSLHVLLTELSAVYVTVARNCTLNNILMGLIQSCIPWLVHSILCDEI